MKILLTSLLRTHTPLPIAVRSLSCLGRHSAFQNSWQMILNSSCQFVMAREEKMLSLSRSQEATFGDDLYKQKKFGGKTWLMHFFKETLYSSPVLAQLNWARFWCCKRSFVFDSWTCELPCDFYTFHLSEKIHSGWRTKSCVFCNTKLYTDNTPQCNALHQSWVQRWPCGWRHTSIPIVHLSHTTGGAWDR